MLPREEELQQQLLKKCLIWAFMALRWAIILGIKKKFLISLIDDEKMVRPANFPPGTPGRGHGRSLKSMIKELLIINLQGQNILAAD